MKAAYAQQAVALSEHLGTHGAADIINLHDAATLTLATSHAEPESRARPHFWPASMSSLLMSAGKCASMTKLRQPGNASAQVLHVRTHYNGDVLLDMMPVKLLFW